MRPWPTTALAGRKPVSSPSSSYSPLPASAPVSWKLPASSSALDALAHGELAGGVLARDALGAAHLRGRAPRGDAARRARAATSSAGSLPDAPQVGSSAHGRRPLRRRSAGRTLGDGGGGMRRLEQARPRHAADRGTTTPGRRRPSATSRCRPACPTQSTGPAAIASRRVINDWLKALRQRRRQARGALLRAAEQVPERHARADRQQRAGADRGQRVAVVRRGGDRDGRRRRLHDRHLQAHQAPGRQLRHGRGRQGARRHPRRAAQDQGVVSAARRAGRRSSRRRRRRRAPRCERRRRAVRRPRQPAGARRRPRRPRLRPRRRGRRRRRRRGGAAARRGPRPPGRRSTLPVRWVRGNADREVVAHFDRGDTDPSIYGADAPAERADAFTAGAHHAARTATCWRASRTSCASTARSTATARRGATTRSSPR